MNEFVFQCIYCGGPATVPPSQNVEQRLAAMRMPICNNCKRKTQMTDMNDANKPERMEKHTNMENAINSIEEITGRLIRLRERISGENSVPVAEEDVKDPTACLATVLEYGPSAIRTKIETSRKLIEEITDLLF